ncbi:TIGR02530 family flagellar biosynthesis protein [Clostridium sp. LBM24168]
MGYRIVNGRLHFAQDLSQLYDNKSNLKSNVSGKESFKDVLNRQIDGKNGFTISSHAAERLKNRNINFSENDMKNINSAINRASDRGCSESALLYGDTVLITSIKNRTVITALDRKSSNGGVFTNIDSMVIV